MFECVLISNLMSSSKQPCDQGAYFNDSWWKPSTLGVVTMKWMLFGHDLILNTTVIYNDDKLAVQWG